MMTVCMCAQSRALGTHTKFQLDILNINMTSGFVYFHEITQRARKTLVKQPLGLPDPGLCLPKQ